MTTITVVGSVNIDIAATVPHLPAPGETVLTSHVRRGLGGKGANQAIAAARAGAEVTLIARVGDDRGGQDAIATLTQEGIDTGGVVRSQVLPTGQAFISVDSAGQNQIVVAAGANRSLRPHDLDLLESLVEPGGLILTQAEIAPETVARAAEIAVERGCRFVLNLAPVIALPRSTVAVSDPLIVNQLEAEALGINVNTIEDDLNRAVPTLARSIVVTLGADGAVSARDGVITNHPAPTVVPVDTTGAGDTFVGTLSAGLAQGLDLVKATEHAVSAGARAVQSTGASAPLPSPSVAGAQSGADA